MEIQERILLKAKDLYLRYGIRSITMDMIALQLGISKKTIYHFFEDKHELVEGVMGKLLEHNKERCDIDATESRDAIHEIFLAIDMSEQIFASMNPSLIFDLEKYHPSAYEKYLGFKNKYLYQVIKANMERGIAEGLYRDDLDVEILTRIRLETLMLPFSPVFTSVPKLKMMDVQIQLVEHYMFGIASLKGYQLILKYKEDRNKKTSLDASAKN